MYLPVRKLGELLGKEIGYIGSSQTVVIGSMPESTAPGWYLVSREFVPNPNDYELKGYVVSATMAGDKLSDKFTGTGEEGSYSIRLERYVGNNTEPSFFGEALVEFSKPPTCVISRYRLAMVMDIVTPMNGVTRKIAY